MLIRISLFIAILAGLAITGLNISMVKEKITSLQSDVKRETEAHQKFESQYNQTRNDLEKTNAVLKTTQETLKATQEERDKAVADAGAQQKRADKLNDDLTKTRKERDDAQAELAAYKATGLTPQQAGNAQKEIKRLQTTIATMDTENKVLSQKLKRTLNELAIYTGTNWHGPDLPATMKGKVLVADPKWNFVVLDLGEDSGMLKYGELLVNRNGKLVAKVRVSSVEKDRCVANVIPGWQLGQLMEGDQVIPAYPAS
jgi:Tfp pilus assembly protein PilE